MASTPIKRMMIAKILAMGGEDVMVQRIADGETMSQLAAQIGVSRNFLSGYLNREPDRKAAIARARKEAADALGDQMLHIADGATRDSERVDRLRIDTRRMLAGRYNPEAWGEKSGPQVTVNFNSLHLDALRKVRAEDLAAKALPAVPVLPIADNIEDGAFEMVETTSAGADVDAASARDLEPSADAVSAT